MENDFGLRQEKVIDYMVRSGGFEYCAMPKDHQLARRAAKALEDHLQKRCKRATTGAVETQQRKRDLPKRKRQGIIGDRSEGNPMRIGTGSTNYSMALRSHTYPKPINLMQQPLPQGGTASTRSQADEEPELKKLWIERWKEGGAKMQPKVKGRGRKLVGLLEKSKQRKKSDLTSEEIQQRRRKMLHKVELDFVNEEL
jgi:hypothetical protein